MRFFLGKVVRKEPPCSYLHTTTPPFFRPMRNAQFDHVIKFAVCLGIKKSDDDPKMIA